MMAKRSILIALAVCALGFVSAPRSQAGSDMVIDNSAAAPPPVYSYAPPPPPPVYYAPAPVRVVLYPRFAYYAPPLRFYGYHRFHGRQIYERRHWR